VNTAGESSRPGTLGSSLHLLGPRILGGEKIQRSHPPSPVLEARKPPVVASGVSQALFLRYCFADVVGLGLYAALILFWAASPFPQACGRSVIP
jgi:hypothetical protein